MTNRRVQGIVYVHDSCAQNNQEFMVAIVPVQVGNRSSFEAKDTEIRATCVSYEKVSNPNRVVTKYPESACGAIRTPTVVIIRSKSVSHRSINPRMSGAAAETGDTLWWEVLISAYSFSITAERLKLMHTEGYA